MMDIDTLELTAEERAAEAVWWEMERRRYEYGEWVEAQARLLAEEAELDAEDEGQ